MAHLIHIFLHLALFQNTARAASPVDIAWSPQAQGPEGPWFAVRTWIGTRNTSIDLYPASSGASNVLGVDYCRNKKGQSTCNANPQGYWDPSTSKPPASNALYSLSGPQPWMVPLSGTSPGGILTDWQQIPTRGGGNISAYLGFDVVVDGGYTLGSPAQTYNYDLGTLSLGYMQTGLNQAGNSTVAVNVSPNVFYNTGRIPSASYGLHYGSVTAKVPPSLVYGGYDKAHVLGPIISQKFGSNGETQLQLGDVGLGTATGGQPSSFLNKSQSGLLTTDSTGPSVITVSINPGLPYMVLPRATCSNITQGLPLIYNPNYQIWEWNISDPEYTRIIAGANFLSFTFTQLGTPDVMIKVPFQLLNLTLSSPLSSNNIIYFPCLASSGSQYALGRAFLQAAFYGGNWMPNAPLSGSTTPGTWFLAQAPGPNMTASTITAIADDATQVTSASQRWEESWGGAWRPLPANSPSPSATTTASGVNGTVQHPPVPTGLSVGAQVGIAVPVALVVLAVVAGVGLWLKKRHKAKMAWQDPPPAYVPGPAGKASAANFVEMPTALPPREMPGTIPRFEMA